MQQRISDPDVVLLASIAATLKADYVREGADDPWADSSFAWVRTRPSRQVGKIGEQLVAGWCAAKGIDVVASPGMTGLLKEQPGSRLDGPDDTGEYTVTMEGVDIYNPMDNSITPTGADKVAAWFVDTDYDGRTFCICQAFFPDRTAWDKLARALKDVLEEDAFEAFSGTMSLPFAAGKHECVAVKVIDPRGNEVMRVCEVEAQFSRPFRTMAPVVAGGPGVETPGYRCGVPSGRGGAAGAAWSRR